MMLFVNIICGIFVLVFIGVALVQMWLIASNSKGGEGQEDDSQ